MKLSVQINKSLININKALSYAIVIEQYYLVFETWGRAGKGSHVTRTPENGGAKRTENFAFSSLFSLWTGFEFF